MNLLRLSNLEIRQICYFLMIVDSGNSFSRAAERLYIEQPPLSQRIRALEKQLKVQLFDRRRRPVQLTPAGQMFCTEARQAMALLEHGITQAQRAAEGEIGHLRIGIASSAANGILPEWLRQFRERYPQVTLELRELTAEQQLQALEDKRLDVGLEVMPPAALANRDFRWKVVAEESLVVVLPEKHVLASQATIALISLADEPLILPSLTAFPFYQAFLARCEDAGFQPQLVESTTATWMLTILSLVAAGTGLAILPSNVLNLERQGVVYRPIEALELTRQLLAVWRSQNTSATLKQFLSLHDE